MTHQVRLKWHKLRRRASDPPFQRANLEAGLRASAALEVDLQATADGHFVCLHDPTLEGETTGAGPVAQATRAEIAGLRQLGNDGSVLASRPLFLDELAAAVALHAVAPRGRVQLDLKEQLAGLSPTAVERFAATLEATAGAFTLSGCDAAAVDVLRAATPGLRTGFDPLDFYDPDLPADAEAFRKLAARTLAEAPGVAIYYLEADLILAGLDAGVNLVELVGRDTVEVDAWTVDPDRPDVAEVLRRLLDAGCHQITTNDPTALEALLAELSG
jgi:glycerophosphoryl diester phosphodiesterase